MQNNETENEYSEAIAMAGCREMLTSSIENLGILLWAVAIAWACAPEMPLWAVAAVALMVFAAIDEALTIRRMHSCVKQGRLAMREAPPRIWR